MPITSRGLLERTGLRRDKERERDHKDRISQPVPIRQQQQQQQQQQQLPYQQYSSNATPPLTHSSPRQFSSSSSSNRGASPALPPLRTPQRQHQQQPGLPRTSSDRSDYAPSGSDDAAGPARSSEGAARQRPPAAPQVRVRLELDATARPADADADLQLAGLPARIGGARRHGALTASP